MAHRRSASGIWSLDGDQPRLVENSGDAPSNAPPVVLVPCEHVLLLATPLPPMASTQRRRAALPFAIEEQIAEPLEQVHIALGVETAPGIWLAGVVSHGLMAQWLGQLGNAGLANAELKRARLVPDVLALPVPDTGGWSVDLAGARALVRAGDGSGFAVPLAALDAAWRAAGEPACITYGEPLPPHYAAQQAAGDGASRIARLLVPGLDLRQGRYAAPRRPFNPVWKRIAVVAGIGALAHAAIAVADTIALAHMADVHAAQVRALGSSLQPAVEIGPDLGDAIIALTPDAAASGSSRFMTLLSRSAAALGSGQTAGAPATIWRSVSFDGAAGTLTIELETANIADLQQMAQALTRAGLSAQPGAASTQAGKAVGSFVVRAL